MIYVLKTQQNQTSSGNHHVSETVIDPHHVSPENGLALHVLEAEFADVEAAQACVLLGIRGVVPGVQLVAAKQDGLYHVAALRDLTLDTQLLLQEGWRRCYC